MEFITVRRAGGSLTLTIPKAFVRTLDLAEGARLAVSVEDGKLIAEPVAVARPHYTLEELLAQCDPDAPLSEEEKAWMDDPPRGREVL
jgi:antitoxin ChpS